MVAVEYVCAPDGVAVGRLGRVHVKLPVGRYKDVLGVSLHCDEGCGAAAAAAAIGGNEVLASGDSLVEVEEVHVALVPLGQPVLGERYQKIAGLFDLYDPFDSVWEDCCEL